MSKFTDPRERYVPRDISWLRFNQRVLEEAVDKKNPLLERVKFLAIFVSNLDEFFMVRMAGIMNLLESNVNKRDVFGYYPKELLSEAKKKTDRLTKKLYQLYNGEITDELLKNNISIKKIGDLKKEQKRFVDDYFEDTLFPITTPMAVDPGHPFPLLPSRTIAFAVSVSKKGESHLAIVPIPQNIPRLLKLPSGQNEQAFILVDEILRKNLKMFFQGYKIRDFAMFRIARDREYELAEDFAPDLLKAIEEEMRKRTRAKIVYMEVEDVMAPELLELLCEGLKFNQKEVVRINSHLDLTFLFSLAKQAGHPELCYSGFYPKALEYDNIFDRIKEEDFIVHMPFESFQPTVDLIEAAANDDDVLAIKMTLYRTNQDSSIIRALQQAAKNKKQVTALVEIKARFDEENNIRWVKELEDSGCHVIYGMPGLKIHSKMALVVRREEGRIVRYVHLSTGNYNESTAKMYTDIGYFTCNEDFAKDISEVFNVVTGFSVPTSFKRVVTAPNDLRDYFYRLIDREMRIHKKTKNGFIFAKMNSLEDVKMVDKLYQASQAGVKIQLVVRGICCLIPGVKGLSDNIEVRSIVGRFLEHTRIFVFGNNNKPRYFMSSADWMRRNLDRRVELLFELSSPKIQKHLQMIMDGYWQDNVKSRVLKTDSRYGRFTNKETSFHSQEQLIKLYETGNNPL